MLTLGIGLGVSYGGVLGGGVDPLAPVNTVAPALSTTTPIQGAAVAVSNGTWINTPTSYAYQWYRGAAAIGGATASSYTPVSGDVGSTLLCVVTATNAHGSASAPSNTSSAVGPPLAAPVNTAAPVISPTTGAIGTAIAATTGSWSGNPTPTYTYQWEYFDTSTNIGGATASSYTPVSGDGGHTIACKVTATNSQGSATATSNVTAAVPVTTTYLLDTLGVAASVAYSTRQLKSVSTKALQVTRDSDMTTLDIGFASGDLDTTSLLAFVGGTANGYVSKWYDQSGNGQDLTQISGTLTNCPKIVLAGSLCQDSNAKPALLFPTGGSTQLSNLTATPLASAFTICMGWEPLVTNTFQDFVYSRHVTFGDSLGVGMSNGALLTLLCPGVSNSDFASSTQVQNVVGAIAFTSAAGFAVGGAGPLTATAYSANTSRGSQTRAANGVATLAGFGVGDAADNAQGYIPEVIIFPSVLSSGNLTTVYTSQSAR